jgi:CheY-like chemotaxis protein
MSSKRALVVDDSKSARAFLSRILERHEITVDAADSAEAAIEYLDRNKPDVIFMDHMMPGMDGFQAVQTIKNNPRTSAIPILMYTSQEGDLYLGQARALGAEGVLPKQIKQSDVTRMLYQLRLVADRRGEEQSFARMTPSPQLMPANESAIVVTPPVDLAPANDPTDTDGDAGISRLLPQMALEIRAALNHSLQSELGALRGFISTTLEAHTERLHGDLAALQPAARAPEAGLPPLLPERRNWAAILGWSFSMLALAGAGVAGWLWWQQGAELAALRTDLAAAYAEVETLRSRPEVVSPTPAPVAGPVDPDAVTPAGDAPDAATANSDGVVLVPAGATVESALQAAGETPAAVQAAGPAVTAVASQAPAEPAAPSAAVEAGATPAQ